MRRLTRRPRHTEETVASDADGSNTPSDGSLSAVASIGEAQPALVDGEIPLTGSMRPLTCSFPHRCYISKQVRSPDQHLERNLMEQWYKSQTPVKPDREVLKTGSGSITFAFKPLKRLPGFFFCCVFDRRCV